MTRRLSVTVAALIVALVLAACGDNGADPGAPSTPQAADSITILTSEFAFDPSAVTIDADTDVTVTVDNSGGVVEHDWTIDALNVSIYADAMQATSETINVPAGTYDVYCSIPGHREAGMVGTLTVQ